MNNHSFRKVKKKFSSWCRYLNTKQSQSYKDYITKRNKSTKEDKKARKDFVMQECRTKSKAVWHYIKTTNREASRVQNLKKPDGTSSDSDTDIANTLN